MEVAGQWERRLGVKGGRPGGGGAASPSSLPCSFRPVPSRDPAATPQPAHHGRHPEDRGRQRHAHVPHRDRQRGRAPGVEAGHAPPRPPGRLPAGRLRLRPLQPGRQPRRPALVRARRADPRPHRHGRGRGHHRHVDPARRGRGRPLLVRRGQGLRRADGLARLLALHRPDVPVPLRGDQAPAGLQEAGLPGGARLVLRLRVRVQGHGRQGGHLPGRPHVRPAGPGHRPVRRRHEAARSEERPPRHGRVRRLRGSVRGDGQGPHRRPAPPPPEPGRQQLCDQRRVPALRQPHPGLPVSGRVGRWGFLFVRSEM